jgi:transmembrane sensor
MFLMTRPSPQIPEEIQTAAAAWLARRDRGLGAHEQDRYLEWLQADPQHGQAILFLERAWRCMDHLDKWRPAHSSVPNPDLLAPRRSARWWVWSMGGALAASLVIWLGVRLSAPPGPAGRSVPIAGIEAAVGEMREGLRRQVLPDGSILELTEGAEVVVAYEADERRVRLIRGEAFFTVARDVHRPFVVEASGVAVQALGTAFSVVMGKLDVSVTVTEGSVEVRDQPHPHGLGPPSDPIILTAGQRAVLRYHRLIPYEELPRFREEQRRAAEASQAWQAAGDNQP